MKTLSFSSGNENLISNNGILDLMASAVSLTTRTKSVLKSFQGYYKELDFNRYWGNVFESVCLFVTKVTYLILFWQNQWNAYFLLQNDFFCNLDLSLTGFWEAWTQILVEATDDSHYSEMYWITLNTCKCIHIFSYSH